MHYVCYQAIWWMDTSRKGKEGSPRKIVPEKRALVEDGGKKRRNISGDWWSVDGGSSYCSDRVEK